MTEFGFAVLGGPHDDGRRENPTCYARTTQAAKHIRWTKAKIGKRGQIISPRLTHWARYQDYIEHVRAALSAEDRRILFTEIWPLLRTKEHKVIVDVIVQFRGRRHSDADHVASTIADALFPKAPTHRPGGRFRPVWSFEQITESPGDGLVLARMLDFCDGAEFAFVAVNLHGPYPRDAWLEGNPVKSFPKVTLLTDEPLDATSRLRGSR